MADLEDGIWVRFKADVTEALNGIDEITSKVGDMSKELGTKFGDVTDAWKSGLSDIPALVESMGAGMATAIAAPIAAIEGAALAVGVAFDDAFDKIRAKAGATGETLDALKGSFRDVLAQVPDDAGKVSEALTFMYQRTHETGDALGNLTKNMLDLSRLTGESLEPLMNNITRAFGEWKIATEDQVGAMDKFLVASQETGVSVGKISEAMVKFGPALKELGFTLDQSTALFAKLEQSGANAEKMFAGLKTAVANFAANGMEADEGFEKFVTAVQNADEKTGLLIARQVVGRQSAADWAQAIRDGTINTESLTQALEDSGGAIASGIKDTEDFAEAWGKLKNQMMLALEPLGTVVFGLMNDLVEMITPVINVIGALAHKFGELEPATQKTVALFGLILAAGIPLASFFGVTLLGALTAVGYAAAAVAVAWGAWKLGEWLYQFKPVKDAVDGLVEKLKELWVWLSKLPGVEQTVGAVAKAWDWVKTAASGAMNGVKDFAASATDGLNKVGDSAGRTGAAFQGAGTNADFFGKKAAAAALEMEKQVVMTENAVNKLLMTLPKTEGEFFYMVENGKSAKSMLESIDKQLDQIAFTYGDKLPPAIEKARNELLYMKNTLLSWKTDFENMKLDIAFDKLNAALAKAALDVKQIFKDNRDTIEVLYASSLKAYTDSVDQIKALEGAYKSLGVTSSAALKLQADTAAASLLTVIDAYDRGAANMIDVEKAIAAQLQIQIAARRAVGQSVDDLVPKLQRVLESIHQAALESMTFADALKLTGVPALDQLKSKAEDVQKAFEKITEAYAKGQATWVQAAQANIANLQQQIQYQRELGNSVDGMNAALIIQQEELRKGQQQLTGWQTAFANIGVQVNRIFENDLPNSLTKSIMTMKGFGQAMEDIGKKILETLINGVLKELFKNLDIFDLDLGKLIKGFKELGQTISSVFTGANSAVQNTIGGSGYLLGGGGAAGGASGAAGGLGGVAGAINVVTGAVSAITGVLGYIQGRHMEADIAKMEVTTRGILNQLISLQESANKYWPLLNNTVQLLRLEGIEQKLEVIAGEGGRNVNLAQQITQGMLPPIGAIGEDVMKLGQAIALALNQFMYDFIDGVAGPLNEIANNIKAFHQQAMPFLQAIAESNIAIYNALAKLGNGVQYLTQHGSNSGGNTFNVNVQTNTNNPYSFGQQVVNGMMGTMSAHV